MLFADVRAQINMRRLLIAALLASLSGTVAAKRVLLEDGDEFVAYAEADTIERANFAARMWVLYDYKVKHIYLKWPYWSQRALAEFDCRDKRAQTLHYLYYDGQMGGGELVLSGAILPGLWAPVPSGSVVEKFWKIACSK
jgi:hypothetical protein